MDKEKDFFKTCFNTVAGLEVKNESQAIAKEVVLSEIETLEQQCKKQKEAIDKIMNLIKQYGKYDGKKCTRGFQMWSADFNKILDILKEGKNE